MAINIVSIENLSKKYSEKTLFEPISFGFEKNEKIGLLGINGCGKSTFLKMLAGIEPPDTGNIVYQSSIRIDYLPQNPILNEEYSIIEQIYSGNHPHFHLLNSYNHLSRQLEYSFNQETFDQLQKINNQIEHAHAWDIDYKAKATLDKFGFRDNNMLIKHLSGGQKRKIDLVRVLLDEPDVLLMDEPTNHLDTDIIEYLQDCIINFKGTVIFVTHDRYFLDAVCTKIMEIDNQKIRFYPGNYADYLERKQMECVDLDRKETRRQAQLKKELKWLHRGAKARTSKPKDHVDRVKELLDKSYLTTTQELDISFQTQRLGKTILELKNITIAYDKVLLKDFNYTFQKHDRIGIIGSNGCGKTSLLKVITEELKPFTGSLKFGLNTKLAVLRQEEPILDPKKSVIEYIREEAENIRTKDGVLHTADQILEKFLFDGKMQQSKISSLSGGEKKRLFLLRSLMFGSNFLILDEPTNDLDIRTLEVLEDFLDAYNGCIFIISHDRFILDRVVDYLFIFEEDQSIRKFAGNYSDYLLVKRYEDEERKAKEKEQQPAQTYSAKNIPIKKLSYKEEKELESIEKRISEIDQNMSDVKALINERASLLSRHDFERLSGELESYKQETNRLMNRWEELETKKQG